MKKRCLVILFGAVVLAAALSAQGVRRAVWAGQFYEANRERLAALIESFFKDAGSAPVLKGDLQALIVPHAGYVYSGKTAAAAYRLLRGKTYESAVIIGPSHRFGFKGCSIWPGGGFETPLGTASVDAVLAAEIAKASGFGFIPEAHQEEHSIEVQVPFIQTVLPQAKIVPIVMGFQTRSTIEALASALAATLPGKNVVVIASTDMSHFLSRKEARKLDLETTALIQNVHLDTIISKVTAGENIMCGGGGVAAVLSCLKKLGKLHVEILRNSDSLESGTPEDSVVGYLAAALTIEKEVSPRFLERLPAGGPKEDEGFNKDRGVRQKGDGATIAPTQTTKDLESREFTLSSDEKKELLKLAQDAIALYVHKKQVFKYETKNPRLFEAKGAFVTLHKHGELRGCIGFTEPLLPLFQTIIQAGIYAATEDPRFPSVSGDDLRDLEIEISVLTPLRKISDPAAVRVGKHGLLISRGGRRGLLLPQVPVENNWDRETFLEQACLKAGLPGDAWKTGAEIFTFEAIVFK